MGIPKTTSEFKNAASVNTISPYVPPLYPLLSELPKSHAISFPHSSPQFPAASPP